VQPPVQRDTIRLHNVLRALDCAPPLDRIRPQVLAAQRQRDGTSLAVREVRGLRVETPQRHEYGKLSNARSG